MTHLIVPIVEGHSEVLSIPAFLRRVLKDSHIFDFEVDRAIREHRNRLVKPDVLINRIRMAEHRPGCSAVLVVFDADDDAACELGPRLLGSLERAGITTPRCVVLAVREIEAWLLAGVESLRGCRGIPEDLSPPENPESIRGAKEWLDRSMKAGYKPTIDQLPLLKQLDYSMARSRAPSLDKLLRDIARMVEVLR